MEKETIFSMEEREITLNSPILCKIDQIIQFNNERKFVSVILQDSNNVKLMGFIYGDFYSIILDIKERDLLNLPLNIRMNQSHHIHLKF